MKISTFVCAAISAVIPTASHSEDAPPSKYNDQTGFYAGEYLCFATAAGGVKRDQASGSWRAVTFNVKDERFVMKIEAAGLTSKETFGGRLETAMGYKVSISSGEPRGTYDCNREPNRDLPIWFGTKGMFKCEVLLDEYWLNLSNGIFQRTSTLGYVDGGGDTPNITIGECARF